MAESDDRAEHLQVTRDGRIVQLRIDSREDLAMPLEPDHAVELALMLQRAAAEAKRWKQENE